MVSSGKTTRQILDNGVREALADACVPVKVYFSHAIVLINQVAMEVMATTKNYRLQRFSIAGLTNQTKSFDSKGRASNCNVAQIYEEDHVIGRWGGKVSKRGFPISLRGRDSVTEHDLKILAVFFNTVIVVIMLVSGFWVGIDARKTGRARAESIMWGIFAGWMLIVGPVIYYFFKNKFYK